MTKKVLRISLIATTFCGLVGLIFGSFFDGEIAAKIGDQDNLFAILMSGYGIVVPLSVCLFASIVLYFCPRQESKILWILLKICGILGFILISYFEISEGIKYANSARLRDEKATFETLFIVFVFLVDLLMIMIVKTKVKYRNENLLLFCFIVVVSIAISSALGEVIKYLASRPRPYTVQAGIENFRYWYQFKPFYFFKTKENNNNSFVSGHTANTAIMILSLPLLISTKKSCDNKFIIISGCLTFLFTIVMGFSRLIIDDHYLSDVSAGLILGSIAILLGILIAKKIYNVLKKK